VSAVEREVNGAKSVDQRYGGMNRQQIIAVIFTVLMVGSMVAWGATLI
jgi:surface glycoprotein (TIGR04207 family)